MNQDEKILAKRLLDLANMAYQRNVPFFSDFLNLNEQNVFQQIMQDMPPISCSLMGGYRLAERKIAAFLPYEVSEEDIPYKIICIRPINAKFSEELSHRDFLGALLNLGIDRSVIGDIIVANNEAFAICKDKMSDYIIEQLVRVKHTTVVAAYTDSAIEIEPKKEIVTGTVSSVRLDSVLSIATGISRNHIIDYIEGARVFVNGKLITTNSYGLKEDDIISVRHVGRFVYAGTSNVSKKGRLFVNILKFV